MVKTLQPFPAGMKPFADCAKVNDKMQQQGFAVNTSMCADCPAMSAGMEIPHYFAHVYAGLEMLQHGQEEFQMCCIVKQFVHDNLTEMKCDTNDYFSQLRGCVHSLVRFVNAITKKFVPPSPALVYLLARACNVHTHVHFKNCVWSTVDDNYAYYVAVDLVAVGDHFVMLQSLEQEQIEVVVGEVKVLCDPDNWWATESVPDENVSVSSEYSDFEPLSPTPPDVSTKECSVHVTRLPLRKCFPQVFCKVTIPVEHLSCSILSPGRVFRSEKPSKSSLYPGRLFRGQYDWRQCTVPTDRSSVSSKKPGRVFSATVGPRDRTPVSSKKPGFVFSNQSGPMPNWSQCTVPVDKPSRTRPTSFVHHVGDDMPSDLTPQLQCKRVSARKRVHL